MMIDGTIIEKQRFPSPNPTIKLYVITYISEGLKVKGYLAEPITSEKLPGLLYLRGGIKSVGMVRIARVIQFAAEGFVVIAPFYRGNRGGEGNEDFGGNDRWDAVHAFTALKNHPATAADSLHIFGFSRGGIMALWTALLVETAASLVTWGGVSDLTLTYQERVDLRRMMKRVIGGTPWNRPFVYLSRDPLLHVAELSVKVLIIHGKKDMNVTVEHAHLLENLLQSYGKQVESWIFPEFDHYFPPKVHREVTEQACRWMKHEG